MIISDLFHGCYHYLLPMPNAFSFASVTCFLLGLASGSAAGVVLDSTSAGLATSPRFAAHLAF